MNFSCKFQLRKKAKCRRKNTLYRMLVVLLVWIVCFFFTSSFGSHSFAFMFNWKIFVITLPSVVLCCLSKQHVYRRIREREKKSGTPRERITWIKDVVVYVYVWWMIISHPLKRPLPQNTNTVSKLIHTDPSINFRPFLISLFRSQKQKHR